MLSSWLSRLNGPFCNENRGFFLWQKRRAGRYRSRCFRLLGTDDYSIHRLNDLILPRQYIKCTCLLISEQRKGTIRERQSEDEPKNEASSDQSDQTHVARHPCRAASPFSEFSFSNSRSQYDTRCDTPREVIVRRGHRASSRGTFSAVLKETSKIRVPSYEMKNKRLGFRCHRFCREHHSIGHISTPPISQYEKAPVYDSRIQLHLVALNWRAGGYTARSCVRSLLLHLLHSCFRDFIPARLYMPSSFSRSRL